MNGPLRIGVIGAGNFGRRHVEAYARQPGVEIVGIADRDVDRARSAAAQCGAARWFDDGAALVEACRPDGVSVVTPASHHLAPTLAALANGCSVLLEKPVALSAADAGAIEAAADASSGFVMPAHILRFAAPYLELRDRLHTGAIGGLLAIATLRDRGRGHAELFPDVHPALMTTIHDIDLALWLSGARAVRVSAHGRGNGADGRPLLLWACVDADDGSVWDLRVSWLLPDSAPSGDRLEVYGASGAIVLDLKPTVTLFGAAVEGVDHELTPAGQAGAIDAEIAHFCDSIRAGVEPTIVTLGDAVHGIRVAEAIIASADSGGAVIDLRG